MADKVGKKTGKKTQVGKDVYKTPKGKNVSEISSTFKYKGKWINVPSIHKGYEYDDDILKLMLDVGIIEPTSVHDSRTEAEAEARDRSDRLKFNEGGMATEEERLNFQPVDAEGRRRRADQDRESITFKEAATFVAEMTPIVGDAMAAKQIYDEVMKPNPDYKLIAALGGAAVVGLIPGVGDAVAAGIRKTADVAKRIEMDPNRVGMMGGNIRIRPAAIKEEDYLTIDNPDYKQLRGQVDETTDINAAEALLDSTEEDIAKIREAQAANRKQDEAGKRPFAEEAQALERNEITSKEFREKAFADVEKFTELEQLPTFTEIVFALDKNKREKGIIGLAKSMAQGAKKIAAGDKVMARLDIPAYNRFDVYVPQITFKKEGAKGAESVFSRTMVIEDVKFPTPQKPSFDIARGEKTKYPHATINGQVASNPTSKKMYTDQEAHDLAKSVFDDPDFVHVGYNPDRGGFFYDRETNMPVFDSPLVVQIGKQIFAKRSGETSAERIAKMRKMDLRKTSPDIKKPTLFNEGGMTVQDQMEMNFGTRGVDPVSGNEVPIGSLPEEVRDDIPAQLSEGEYVVPADVVRYYGVKFFEDLRTEAKLGFDAMDEAGRIGGEPVAMNADDEGLGLDLSDLEVVEVQAMSEGGDAKGAYTFDNIKKKLVRKQAENKPVFRNRAEEIIYNIRNMFGDRDDKPKKATDKPPIDFGFGGNPMERAERKYGSPSSPTKNESYRPSSATQREVYKPKSNQPSILEQINFNEGGTTRVVDEGKTGQLLPDDFDPVLDSVGGGVMEMREYQNAAGHTLMIPFLNGVPQTVIPDGYFPVGSTPVVTPVNTAGSSGSRNNDSNNTEDITEPFNYKELTIDELTQEVKNLQETPNFLGTGIFSGIVAIAQKRHRNKLIEEIDRRLSNECFKNPNAEVFGAERSYLENLKEVAEAPPEKGMVGKLIDKITGEETEQLNLPNLEDPTYSELPSIKEVGEAQVEESYTPEAGTDTTPSPSREKSAAEQIQESIKDAADRRVIEEAKKISADAAQKAFKVSTPKPTPVSERSAGQIEARQGTQDVLKSMRDRGATREERTEAVKEGARIEDVRRDLDRGIIRGFEKGGSVDKPKVKEVVKGLKKASLSLIHI